MAFIPVPNTAEVVLQGNFASSGAAYLTLAFEQAAPFNVTDLGNLLDAVETWWASELSEQIHNAYNLPTIKATALDSDSAPSVTRVTTLQPTGQKAGAMLATSSAMVVSFLTDNRGRSYRGRNYVPGLIATELLDVSHFSVVIAGAMQNAYTALQTVVGGAGFDHVVISRRHDNAPRVTGVTTPVVAYQAKQAIASQRRRNAAVGA